MCLHVLPHLDVALGDTSGGSGVLTTMLLLLRSARITIFPDGVCARGSLCTVSEDVASTPSYDATHSANVHPKTATERP